MDLRNAKKKALFCPTKGHTDQPLTHYAPTTGRLLCAICALEDDSGAAAVPLADAAQEERAALAAWAAKLESTARTLGTQKQQLEGYAEQIEQQHAQAMQAVDELVTQLTAALDAQRQALHRRLGEATEQQLKTLGAVAAAVQAAAVAAELQLAEGRSLVAEAKDLDLVRGGGALRSKPVPTADASAMAQLTVPRVAAVDATEWAAKALTLQTASLLGAEPAAPPARPTTPESSRSAASRTTGGKLMAVPARTSRPPSYDALPLHAAPSSSFNPVAPAAQSVVLVSEKCTCSEGDPGGAMVISDLRGELIITLAGEADICVLLPTERDYSLFSWKPHANMDAEVFEKQRRLEVKPGGATFPLLRPLSLLKWKSTSPIPCPLRLTRTSMGPECTVALHTAFPFPVLLSCLAVTIPLLGTPERANVSCSAGTVRMAAAEVRWEIPRHQHYPSDRPPVESLSITARGEWRCGPLTLVTQSTASISGHGVREVVRRSDHAVRIPFKASNSLSLDLPL